MRGGTIIGLFAARLSSLPRLELGAIAFERVFIHIEDARIARAAAAVVVTGPQRWHRRRIVLGLNAGCAHLTLSRSMSTSPFGAAPH